MMGNINSYSRILNNEESLERIAEYNDLVVGISMINSEKGKKVMENTTKNWDEAATKKKKKVAKYIDEATKRKELIGGFEAELRHKNMAGILGLQNSGM